MFVKICGLTTVEQADACVSAGANAIGLNLISTSPRRVDASLARTIARHLKGRALVVLVIADLPVDAMRELLRETEADSLQLHGHESAASVAALVPNAYKAARIGSVDDVKQARAYAGNLLLVDAKVSGELGGTGKTFDWPLVADLAKQRRILLAGGLHPENVGAAVAAVRPYGVDVASGVEDKPGLKNLDRVRRFIEAARGA